MSKVNRESKKLAKLLLDIWSKAEIVGGFKISNLDDLLSKMENGYFTLDDYLASIIECMELTEKQEIYWEKHMENYFLNCYLPEENKKLPEGGSWIKIRTDSGYNMYFGKKARNYDLNKDYLKKKYELDKYLLKSNVDINKADSLFDSLTDSYIKCKLGIQPYRVTYYSESGIKYVTPNEYELVESLDDHIELSRNKVSGVALKVINTAISNDKIFYLRSRGIPKELAIIMSNIGNCYFEVNMKELTEEYSNRVKYVLVNE